MSPIFLADDERGRYCFYCGGPILESEEEWPDDVCSECLKDTDEAGFLDDEEDLDEV